MKVLAVDIGGTHANYGLIESDREIDQTREAHGDALVSF